ncbi:MAG: hypothetical protein IJU29_01600 [Oscillospiraceae bacterium]|nr:hypothetical protein [Oscillospiraceae bacterium]
MQEQASAQCSVEIEVRILPDTLSTLETMANIFQISIGEAIDHLVSYYHPGTKQQVSIELGELLEK